MLALFQNCLNKATSTLSTSVDQGVYTSAYVSKLVYAKKASAVALELYMILLPYLHADVPFRRDG